MSKVTWVLFPDEENGVFGRQAGSWSPTHHPPMLLPMSLVFDETLLLQACSSRALGPRWCAISSAGDGPKAELIWLLSGLVLMVTILFQGCLLRQVGEGLMSGELCGSCTPVSIL